MRSAAAPGRVARVDPEVRALAPRWRALRVAVLGSASLGLATAAHAAAGGEVPSLGALLVSGLLLGLVAVPLTMRRCRLPALVAVLAVEQLGLHVLFEAAAGSGACAAGSGHHLAVPACAPTAATASTAGMVAGAAPSDWSMLIAHLVALLATAWVLARGEQWLWRAVDALVTAADPSMLGILEPAPVPVVVSTTSAYGHRPHAPLPARGPPVRA